MARMFLPLCVFLVGFISSVVAAEGCQDVGVVVVASVFGTLAVVLIVLGIVGFLLWKRRRDLLKPAKLHDDPDSAHKESYGYANPAFDKDPELGDTGSQDDVGLKVNGSNKDSESIPSREVQTFADRDKKTWASLPNKDTQFSRSRKSSTGSLDRNTYYSDDDLVSVCLTSQDFIGLGFNVAGSMRDGIFVSQVHNRGPAKDSGKFKVGDRLLSLTISFENMVYEDALTILSYASPYPVKVTLQKQTEIPKNKRLSDLRTSLNHPLYRSQSVDTLQTIGKEPLFHPKRSNSEIRHEDSPKTKRVSKGGSEGNIVEETNAFLNTTDNDVFTSPLLSKADVTVHKHVDGNGTLGLDREVSIPVDSDIPNASLDLNAELAQSNPAFFGPTADFYADPFQNLTEEDKLDVIRLSYDDPDHITPEEPVSNLETEVSPPSPIFGDQKNIPMKPERKKKRGSTTSGTSQSDGELTDNGPSSPSSPVPVYDETVVNDIITASLVPPTEAPPPPPPDNEAEADEDIIQPLQKERFISINTDTIVFEPVDLSKLDMSDGTIVADTSMNDSFSDNDTTLIKPPSPFTRADSSDGEEIDEVMAATQLKRDSEIPNFGTLGFVDRNEKSSSSSLSSSSSEAEDKTEAELIQEKSVNVEVVTITETSPPKSVSGNSIENVEVGEHEFDKDLPELDMNLGFDADSVLFQERFPSRNEKENDGGIAFDISVTELESMERKVLEEESSKIKNESKGNKGGIAFEIRDDYTTGQTRTVNTNNVHRTASYEIKTDTGKLKEHEISSQRPTSLKTENKSRNELDSGKLDWSGQRLVRSGSFSEIPQDDTVKDWTDQQNLSVEDALIEKHIKEDSKSPVLKKLTKATLVTGKTNMVDLSDSDSNCRSISSSSGESRDSSPVRENNVNSTNGEDDGLGTSLDTTPVKIIPVDNNNKSDIIPTVTKYGDSDQAFTVTLNKAAESEEEDC